VVGGGHHAECGVRAYNGGLGAAPLVRGLPPEAESILVIGCPTEPANLAPFQKYPFELRYVQQCLTENSMLCYGPLVSELGVPECMVPPNPIIGGLCPHGSAAYGLALL